VLEQDLVAIGVRTVLLIDMAGNIITQYDNGNCSSYDLRSLAVLASANSVAMDIMARSLGEKEFSLHLLKGKSKTAHFTKVDNRFLLITVSDRDVSLGQLRLKIAEAVGKMKEVSEILRDVFLRVPLPLGFSGQV